MTRYVALIDGEPGASQDCVGGYQTGNRPPGQPLFFGRIAN